jgi:hypothetical protein
LDRKTVPAVFQFDDHRAFIQFFVKSWSSVSPSRRQLSCRLTLSESSIRDIRVIRG